MHPLLRFGAGLEEGLKTFFKFLCFFSLFLWPCMLQAHFQVLLPSQEIVSSSGPQEISLRLFFTHPSAGGPTMDMAPPLAFGVLHLGQKIDLTSSLKAVRLTRYICQPGKPTLYGYEATYLFKAPGDYLFYLVPRPYFEEDEGRFIQQITKVVVNAYGAEEGWDKAVGLPVEIIPLTRPYGLFEGQLFRGLVLKEGRPAAHIKVEVEYYNRDCQWALKPPFETQVVKTDAQGVFSYSLPWAGWWGFSALTEGGVLKRAGRSYPLELDAVIWIKAYPRPSGVK